MTDKARRLRLLRRPDEPASNSTSPSPRPAGRSSTSRWSSGRWSRCTTCPASSSRSTSPARCSPTSTTGKVTKWNDPKLAALNPGVNLPDLGIQPVSRADSSGTTFIFTDYLAKVSPEFKAEGRGEQRRRSGRSGSGSASRRTTGWPGTSPTHPGAIGYVELTYALDTKSQYGAVVNKAGKAVRADLASITAAAAASLGEKPTAEPYSLHDLTYTLTDAAGRRVVPDRRDELRRSCTRSRRGPKGKAAGRVPEVGASAEGQKMAEKRNYAPLPRACSRRRPGRSWTTVEQCSYDPRASGQA